jgi:hypothetical protein
MPKKKKGGSDQSRPFNLSLSDWFWSVIDRIRNDPDSVEELFNGMSQEQLGEFYYSYREASSELYPGCCDQERGWSEEDIGQASDWVVNQGKEVYLAVWNDLSLFPDPDGVPFCDHSGIAARVSWDRYGKELCG